MRRLLAPCLLCTVAACSSAPEARLGTFQLAWTEQPASLTVRASDGRELLRTAGPFLDSRTTSADLESQFGSFRVTEGDEAWREADALEVRERAGDHVTLALKKGDADLATLRLSTGAEGELDLAITSVSPANRIRTHFACAGTDHFLGFGGQQDAVDHRGHKIPVWISEPGVGKIDDDDPTNADWMLRGTRHASSYPLPTFLSNRGFAFLADTTNRVVFDVCKADPKAWSVEAWDKAITLKLFDGPEPAKAIERLTKEIGRQPLANDLALAPWNDAIFGSDNVRSIAKALRDAHIPSGAIWTEDFRGGEQQGNAYRLSEEWDVDRTLYPDVEQLSSDLHAQGFRFLAYHNTFLTDGTKVLENARKAGVLIHQQDGGEYLFTGVKFTPTSMVDFTHPQGGAFVEDALKTILSRGFDGWMADYGEWLPPDAKLADGSDPERAHDTYPRSYFQHVQAALQTHADQNLATSFSRSGTLRTAPLQPVVWAGDQSTNFAADDGLPTVIPYGLNLGLAGVSTFGHDIGGYQNGTGGPSTKELFFRWTTLGALSPVMRTHHGTQAKANWWWGKDEETTAHFRRWARLHARLWPYLKLAAKEAFDSGMPIMRQLALAYPQDEAAWTTKDEYLFGPAFLVAPVVTEGATQRLVHLPADRWLPVFSGEARTQDTTEQVPLTEAAFYARAGSIVPLLPERLDTLMPAEQQYVDLDDVRGERSLWVFGGARGSTTDLDGTRYSVDSQGNDQPTAVLIDGSAVPTCADAGATTCATLEADTRTVRVRGEKLTKIAIQAGDKAAATITVDGALKVTEVVYRY